MKKKFLFLGFLMLLSLLIWQCGEKEGASIPQDITNEFARFPGSPIALAYMNAADIRNSDFQPMLDKMMSDPHFMDEDYRDFEELTGLKIRKDIDEIFVGLETIEKQKKPEFLMVVKGRFNPEKIVNFIEENDEENKLTRETYKEFSIYTGNNETMGFSFADDSRLILGKTDLVKQWLDNYQTPGIDKKLSAAMKNQMQTIKYKNGAWFVMSTEKMMNKLFDEFGKNPRARQFEGLRSLQQINFSLKFDKKMHFNGTSIFSEAQNAELFRDMIKGFIATAKLTMSSDRQVVDILNKIEVKNIDNKVVTNFEFSPDEIEKLQNERKKIAHIP